ncbi:RNA polymerase sigma factor [Alicyclobacillus dauci]|uniref:Sigma-70 family RNA polymerase sigma factor n=1 Tax=Alicyclobacillus dauci TaxID=1475485 RepID=A0ABY6Z5C4_9BACL|nr:sigma-70 family RNA polymerase sigma factor [Alicyclobacillus dauci]WAH38074.1 sigma-70 family RNA polymerase sigma factor [Alicyclobacillus dauci]
MTPNEVINHLIDLYSDDIYRFALHTVGNHADAKDIVQEVFLRSYQAWGKFRHDSSPKTWLFHIARNYMKDYFRRKAVRDEYIRKQDQSSLFTLDGIEERLDLQMAISLLPFDDRQVIILRFIEDLSVADTAQVLDWSEAKVRTKQHRSLKRLRGILDATESGKDVDNYAPEKGR